MDIKIIRGKKFKEYENFLKENKIFDEIIQYLEKETLSLRERAYCWFYKIVPKKCEKCGEKTTFISINRGYSKYCSSVCSNSDKKVQAKKKETCLERYGVEHPAQSIEVQEKTKETCLERYGAEYYLSSKISNIKKKETCLERYGVEHQMYSERIKQKIKETCLERYGVEHPAQSIEVQEKTKETWIKRFGGNPSGNQAVKQKRKETFLKKYGVDHPFKDIRIKEKFKNTCLKKFGTESPLTNKDVRFKARKTIRFKKLSYFLKILELKDFELISSKETILDVNKKISIRCRKCNKIKSLQILRLQDICCSCGRFISSKEKEIAIWLKNIGLNIIENDRSALDGKELDIYIPEQKLAIEYNGLYWHCELNKEKNYHLQKTLACQEKSICLIHIFENEWINKQNIVKSIIKAKLGLFDEKIYGRKCELKEISQQEYDEFLELNHLQGLSISKIRLGLYYKDELVSVMGFGKSRFKKDETELIRFANKLNTSVIGGFSKLLKHYINKYKPENLVSYCDLRYFDGSGYLKNGFEIIGRSKPNYYYWKPGILDTYSRIQFQKHKLKSKLENFDEDLTEHENMLNNGYYRIYDCGNLKVLKK